MSYPLSASLLEFWRSRLEGDPQFFVLPGTKPRPAKRTFRSAACGFDLMPCLYDTVRDLARSRGTSPDRILLAAFAVLLHRYSHQEKIRIGAMLPRTSGERGGAAEGIIFLDCTFANGMAFPELLAGIDHEVKEAAAFGCSSPEALGARLGVECDPSYPPFCNVAFQFAGQSVEPYTAEPALTAEDRATVFDLELRLMESKHSATAELRYYADVFTANTATSMTKHFTQLLQAIVDAPAGKINALLMILPEERQQVLVEWNRTKLGYEQEKCLHELVEEQADRTPDEIALICQGRQLSYRELNAEANRLARYLVKLGVGPEVLVGICMDRSLETLVGILGVLKAGGAYVPLDPDYPAERCVYMAQDAGIHVLLTEERLMTRYSGITAAKICLRSRQQAISAEPSHNLPRRAIPGNLAYVLYTSGSTGRPKGVGLQHGNAVAFVKWASTAFTRDELAGVLACTSLSFDLSIFELFVTLACGGKVMLVKNALEAAVSALPGLTLINTVPSAMNELVRMKALPHSVQTVNLAGEPLSSALAHDLYQSGIRRVLNLYGPTEATTYATWCEVSRNAEESPGIGAPLANMRIYVLDANFQPVPIGVSGEIFIGGDGLARGYINRPELTAEKFVPDPFSTEECARLYRTGDLGLWRGDGNLEFLGRADQQVKVRGFRIELAEIEATLLRQPGVRETAVVVREDATRQKSIVAYLVPAEGSSLRPAALRSGLQQSLPEYMVPSEFITLPAMPYTPSGKLDRKRLLSLGNARPMMDTVYAAPRSAAEKQMADIWSKVLQIDRVGVNDRFLELGGHSLLAMRLAAEIREAFEVEIPFGCILENPTLASLVERIRLLGRNPVEHAAPILPGHHAEGRLLSYAQQRLWFLHQFHPENFAYNIPVELRLKGQLDREALRSALTEMVRRHAVLRTVYKDTGDTVQQVVQEPGTQLEYRDLSGCEDPQAELERVIQQEAQHPFDLAQGPVMRELLMRLSAEEHALLLTIHHIAADGWSIDVLVRELGVLYPAFLEGRPSPLPHLAVQYSDYAVWERERLQGRVLERQMEYWKKQLASLPAPLELPGAVAFLPADKAHIGAEHRFTLPAELFFALQQTSHRLQVTLHMILLAAFQLLLCRYTGQEDIVVASPVAGRNQKPTEDLIGFFVNTLLLRTRFSAELSVEDLLGRVRDTALEAYAYQDLPFERLVEILQPERDLSGTPLVQAMFSLEKDELRQWTMAGITATARERWNGSAKFDLTLIFEESAQELTGIFEYRKHLLPAGTVERLAQHLTTLLSQMVEHQERKISELELLTPEEHGEVGKWNQTSSSYPREQCVHELFREQAESVPGAEALRFAGQQLTYAELNFKSNQLAHRLRQLGSAPETMVGLCVEPSLEMAVGLLGILKSGAAYVPLDPGYPKERLAFMLQETGVGVLVTQQKMLGRMPSLRGVEMVCIDPEAWQENIVPMSGEDPAVAVYAENLAYGMFTSGSTGKPKCVAITHRGILRLVRNTNYIQIHGKDRMAQISNLSFDALTFEVWGALLNGAALVALDRDTALDAKRLAEAIREQGISVMLVTTALFNQIAREMPEAFSSLRVLLFGGEAADASAVRRVLGAGAPSSLVNAYGPTENTTLTSWYPANDFPLDAAVVPIGGPIANTTMYVLDLYGQPAPAGVTGELYAGGDGLARGYLGRPELTAERFVPDPFALVPGQRLYRTGDLVRRLPDGQIEFVARNDQQVKFRGFRIELAEVEAALRECAAVREAIVMLREDSVGDKRLVAYVAGDKAIQSNVLRSHLAERLPDYMLPGDFVVLEKFPLTPSGKIDRKALPVPERLQASETYAAPRNMIEQLLADLWAEVLRVERTGIHEDFFGLGGHSLLAMQIISRIRGVLGIDLPVRQLFEQRTIANLARSIDAELKQSGPEQMPPLVLVERHGEMPLSFAQQRLWFLYQFESDLSLYNIPIVLRLTGELRAEALAKAVNEILRRHEPLRTSFGMRRGTPFQVVHAHQPIEVPGVELSRHPPAECEAEVARRVRVQVQTPFNLSRAPLLRGELLRLGPEEHVLILVLHHIAADGWSLSVFAKELATLYEAFADAKKPPLPELPVQYLDYVIWQRQWLQSGVEERQFAYWKRHLAHLPEPLELPMARPRPAKPNHSGAEYDFEIPRQVQQLLYALGRNEGATLFMTTLAAFLILLHQYTQQTDVIVGTPTAGRTLRETEDLIGFFVNTLVLRTDLSGNPTFAGLLKRVRDVALAAYANQDVPFERLVEVLQPQRDMSRSPLFQIMFVLQNAPPSEWALPGLTLKQQRVELGREKFDLTLFLTEDGNGLHATIAYSTELFEEKTISAMAEHYKVLLEECVTSPDRRIDELPLLTAVERRQIIEEWNRRQKEHPPSRCVHELVVERAVQMPEVPAVVEAERQLTYAELNRCSNQLAHYLEKFEVEPEIPVGICMEPSLEMVVAVLAVFKAGGACVLLDASNPKERLRSILQDSQTGLVLATSRTIHALPACEAEIISMDRDLPLIAMQKASAMKVDISPENLAYVVYTSSAGKTEGVAMTHGGLASLVQQQREDLAAPAGTVLTFASPDLNAFFHETFLQEIFSTLEAGSTLDLREDKFSSGCAQAFSGKPFANAQVYVLNSAMDPPPVGVPGEVYLSGDGLARGYFRHPELTAERFVPNPWSEAGERLFHTGSRARRQEHGGLEFLGRIEEQRKIKGDRTTIESASEGRDSCAGQSQSRNPAEELLASIWAEVLQRNRVSMDDNFFDLGGHSLLAMRIVFRIREVFRMEVAVREVFERPTVRALAESLVKGRTRSLPPLRQRVQTEELPLSCAQQRLWFLYQFQPGQSNYNLPFAVRLEGPLKVDVLEKAFAELVERHPALRTTFRDAQGRAAQVIHPYTAWRIEVKELPANQDEHSLRKAIKEEAARPFDLISGPVVRTVLFRKSAEESWLVLTLHHIAADGWSMEVLFRELQALYEAFLEGRLSPLPPLAVQYSDYAIWQQEWLQSEEMRRQLEYWKNQLPENIEALELSPVANSPSPQESTEAEKWRFEIPAQLFADLKVLCKQAGTTLYMTLLAAFQLLLHRHTGRSRIVVGSPVAGRNHAEAEPLIGCFVNMLLMCPDLSNNPTVLEVLERVRTTALDAYANQDLPFERLVEELQPERNSSSTPLLQVVFMLRRGEIPVWKMGPVNATVHEIEAGSAKFDISLVFEETAECLAGFFEYFKHVCSRETVARMALDLEKVLLEMVTCPESRIEELGRLTEEERRQVIEEQRRTVVPYERDQCVQELFEAQAKRTPEAVAVAFAGERLTYRQLNQRANQMAHHLRRFGVGPEVPVGLFMERSLEMIIGILGIVKAGGVYVPLDPEYPADRLTHMIQDSGVGVLLTQDKLRKSLEFNGPAICLDQHWPAISAERQSNPEHLTIPENLIYVMYTSGSTGRPKGTAVPHRGVVRLVRNTNYARFGSDQVFLQFAPISFDASTLEIWGSLLNGARLEIMPPEMPSLQVLGEAVVRHGVTVLWLTAGLFHQMVDHQPEALRSVRQLLAGGDVLSVPHVRKLLEGNRETQLINGYGPTENTTFTCCYPVPGTLAAETVPIGVSVANTQVYVLDKDMRLVPDGVAGELYIGGDGLARGYLNRPELTAEKFVPNPFSDVPGQRLYRTGDLAKRDRNGVLEFIGRMDDQVKIRGFRIEPREIETVLSEQPGIESAAVVVQSGASGTKRLVAYVVARSGFQVERSELRRALKHRLPEYMVPAAFVMLERLPLTPNGKVDRKALAQRTEEPLRTEEFTAPRTPVEELLAVIWREVLRTERVGVHDNFFESGGHSLLAMQIISRVREFFPVNLPVRALFECPTVAELAGRLLAHELRPGVTVRIAEAFLGAKENRGEEARATGRNIA